MQRELEESQAEAQALREQLEARPEKKKKHKRRVLDSADEGDDSSEPGGSLPLPKRSKERVEREKSA